MSALPLAVVLAGIAAPANVTDPASARRELGVIGQPITGLEAWHHHVHKCDMVKPWFEGPTQGSGAPAYVEGEWVLSSGDRKSIQSMLPMECDELTTSLCSPEGCLNAAGEPPGQHCAAFYEGCFADRSSAAFKKNLVRESVRMRMARGGGPIEATCACACACVCACAHVSLRGCGAPVAPVHQSHSQSRQSIS